MVLACGGAATFGLAELFQFGTFSRGGCSGPATLDLNFHLSGPGRLDKIPISATTLAPVCITKTFRFGLDIFRLGLGTMKFVTGLLAAVLLLAGVGASHAVVRIADDRGGRIGTYVDKYQGLRTSGETVIIDGLCASACTIVLGAVPHDRICVTSHANLGFHAAWDFGANGRAVTNPEATQMLYSMYPTPVQKWIASRGGLTPRMIFLRASSCRPCTSPATSTPRPPPTSPRRAVLQPIRAVARHFAPS